MKMSYCAAITTCRLVNQLLKCMTYNLKIFYYSRLKL